MPQCLTVVFKELSYTPLEKEYFPRLETEDEGYKICGSVYSYTTGGNQKIHFFGGHQSVG